MEKFLFLLWQLFCTICSVRNYSLKEHGMQFVVDSVTATCLQKDFYLV